MNTQKQIILIVVLSFALVGGCAAYASYDLPSRFELQDEYQYNGRVERGALLYANNCRTCHGIKGEGNVGPALNGTLREAQELANFQDQSPLVLAQNQALIRRTLECGRAGTLMPAWLKANGGALSRIQIEHLVELLTAPATEEEDGQPISRGWLEAEEFAHNLNHEATAIVGGDTLSGLAKSHNIGPKELLEYNLQQNSVTFQEGEPSTIHGLLKRGTKVRLLPTEQDPEGHLYQIRQDNETIEKISDSQNVGSIILAELNDIPYSMNYKTGFLTVYKDDSKKDVVPGLLPGDTFELPDGTTYTIVAEDTIASIATRHALTPAAVKQANNQILGRLQNTDVIDHQQRLELPDGSHIVVAAGDSIGSLAALYGIEPADLASENDREEDAVLNPGEKINLPDDSSYIIQANDTLAKVAARHELSVSALADAADVDFEPNEELPTSVVINLPKVSQMPILGQNITDVTDGFDGFVAADLAEENGVDVNERLYVGQVLHLPPGTYGSTPPDAVNPGTACVEYAVTSDVLPRILGTNFEPIEPDQVSNVVEIDAHSNDWTVISDGDEQEPNQGVVKIAVGKSITFKNIVGVHTIDLNGEKQRDLNAPNQTETLTFPTAGEFEVTCQYHPAMLAWVWVE